MPLHEYDPTEVIEVTRQHLQEVLSSLSLSYNYFAALDLAESVRAAKGTTKSTAITRQIENTYNHIEGYLVEENDVSDE